MLARVRASPYHHDLIDDDDDGLQSSSGGGSDGSGDMYDNQASDSSGSIGVATELGEGEGLQSQAQAHAQSLSITDLEQGALLGQQDPASAYFTRRFCAPSDLGILHNLPLHLHRQHQGATFQLPDLDPQAFSSYTTWRRTGHITTTSPTSPDLAESDAHTWQRSWPLLNAIILGHTIGDETFTRQAEFSLADAITPGVCADSETIERLFGVGGKRVPESLRAWVVERCVDAVLLGGGVEVEWGEMPRGVVGRVLQVVVRRLRAGDAVGGAGRQERAENRRAGEARHKRTGDFVDQSKRVRGVSEEDVTAVPVSQEARNDAEPRKSQQDIAVHDHARPASPKPQSTTHTQHHNTNPENEHNASYPRASEKDFLIATGLGAQISCIALNTTSTTTSIRLLPPKHTAPTPPSTNQFASRDDIDGLSGALEPDDSDSDESIGRASVLTVLRSDASAGHVGDAKEGSSTMGAARRPMMWPGAFPASGVAA